MRTTIDLPDPLFREVKTRAVRQGLKLKDLVAQYIESGLRGQDAVPEGMPSRKRSPLPIAIPRKPDGAVAPCHSNAELYAMLDEEDAAR